MKRLSWPLAMLGFLVLIAGCTKQLPSPDLNFESSQKVILTFRSGEELEGKVAPGKGSSFESRVSSGRLEWGRSRRTKSS